MSMQHAAPYGVPAPSSERRLQTEDPGWRLRQSRPGRWYALNLWSGVSVALPETPSLLEAIGHFYRFARRYRPPARA